MNTALLLVTFNRVEMLKHAINNIEENALGIKELIIVDNNSTDETFPFLQEKFFLTELDRSFNADVSSSRLYLGSENNELKVTVISLSDNTGGSGGFYAGLKYFRDFSQSDWVWGMDDDAFIQPKAFDELLLARKAYPTVNAFWSNCDLDTHFSEKYKYVSSWMFVGFCLNKKLINKVGLPMSDYFIYHDDSEYAERILRNNFDIIKIKDSIIDHGDLSSRKFWTRKILFKELEFPEMSDWKLYYFFRNRIHKRSFSFYAKLKSSVYCLIQLIKLGIINPKKIKIVSLAIYHGIINKKGKVICP